MNKKLLLTGASLSTAIILCAATTANKKPDLSKVNFAAEASTITDPENILVYSHEEIVNSFLSIKHKFGRGRVVEMDYNNTHLATHKGTTDVPEDWTDTTAQYQLQHWGLVGDIAETTPTIYFLKSPYDMGKSSDAGGKIVINEEDRLSARKADGFEHYAAQQLLKGEKLVKWENADSLRFVGGIYAAKSCLSCHADAKEGQVLGAFTYEYQKAERPASATDNEIVKAAREGRSWKELIDIASSGNWSRVGSAWGHPNMYFLSYHLAKGGVVRPEMVEAQKEYRNVLLSEVTQLTRPKVRAQASKAAKITKKESAAE